MNIKIIVEMLVNQINIFCDIYFLLAPLHIAHFGWWNWLLEEPVGPDTCCTQIGSGLDYKYQTAKDIYSTLFYSVSHK